jgi:ABC-type multidrug transport system permease subunit
LYCLAVYWTTGLRPTLPAFLKFALNLYLTFSTAQSMGLMMSIAIPSMQLALVLTPPITLFFMIMGGFYIPFDSMHPGVKWLSWLSFARYAFSALTVNEYQGRDIPCATDEVSISIGSGQCPLPGEDVINSLGIQGVAAESFWFNMAMMLMLQVFFRVAAYLLLRRS